MLLSRLLKAVDVVYKGTDADIKFITDDSRRCCEGSVFVCDKKGSSYIEDALKRGAVIAVCEQEGENRVTVPDAKKAYALLCSSFFGDAHKNLRIVAVTGTNGKTTVCGMLYSILTAAGKKCSLISTVENIIGGRSERADFTTPECFSLHRMLSDIYESGAEYCIMEASSQGLSEERLYGINFDMAVFTNLTEDHLDYHGSMQEYRKAKLKLFEKADRAVINIDDPNAQSFIDVCSGKATTCSVKKDSADFTAKCIKYDENITDYAIVGDSMIHRIRLNLPGDFNVSNSMAAIAVAIEYGISLETCAAALRSFYGVKGRMEIMNINTPFRVIIDYAHTPDGIKQALLSLRSFKRNRIITLFGCGGDRDKSKRALMGKAVAEYSDMAIVTSDNPRTEDPESIIDDILEGMKKAKIPVYIQKNRAQAIEYALKTAQKNDIILLCGKGHETYQIVGEEKIACDEREIVLGILNGV
ncbi:MAG: UDP-N-acetylmuramoyl-L-alanyl-D-glutamate--2,6-diaminopimelate ligase [Clostridia bacterium]|nr:UDP-N-acetylmuramoyl-L-alanyl-D-glutamate--2,6-diaminopimelate ligase [Clostridia bacterium]